MNPLDLIEAPQPAIKTYLMQNDLVNYNNFGPAIQVEKKVNLRKAMPKMP